MSFKLITIPCLSDNYAFLLFNIANRSALLIDAPEAGPINSVLSRNNLNLEKIFLTHHHADHVDGLVEILDKNDALTIGAKADIHRLPKLDKYVEAGDKISFQGQVGKIIDVPGHTVGHIALYISAQNILFSGDSLMALGCGRLFEGSAEQMWHSLSLLRSLPNRTKICSGHEYTENNASFALSIDPKNLDLIKRMEQIKLARSKNLFTVPSQMGLEKKTNPFLRPFDQNIREKLNMIGSTDVEVFSKIRSLKDNF
ncbi:MAG: hydroxyacylglutathione hydrolase [Rhodobacteraceae bacterium]|nr:hydroxyacylglutathione hydrolase [Paracoccaceae bacterium]